MILLDLPLTGLLQYNLLYFMCVKEQEKGHSHKYFLKRFSHIGKVCILISSIDFRIKYPKQDISQPEVGHLQKTPMTGVPGTSWCFDSVLLLQDCQKALIRVTTNSIMSFNIFLPGRKRKDLSQASIDSSKTKQTNKKRRKQKGILNINVLPQEPL